MRPLEPWCSRLSGAGLAGVSGRSKGSEAVGELRALAEATGTAR